MFTEYRGNYCKEDNYPFLGFKIGNWIFLIIYIFIYLEHSLKKFSCSNQAKNIPIIRPCSQIKIWGKSVQCFLSYDRTIISTSLKPSFAFKSQLWTFEPSKEHSSEFPDQYLRQIGRRAYNLWSHSQTNKHIDYRSLKMASF